MAAPRLYNNRSPAVKRLMKEAAELHEPTFNYFAQPLEENLFEWHFTIRGPADTPFEKGIYHGRISLPPEYPMKPPNIIFLTPNGRFETNKKICLSISGYHPETWRPSWSIRTALLAMIGFMPTHGTGAIGSLDYTDKERENLATKSLSYKCETCGLSCNLLLAKDEEADTIKDEIEKYSKELTVSKPAEKNKTENNNTDEKDRPEIASVNASDLTMETDKPTCPKEPEAKSEPPEEEHQETEQDEQQKVESEEQQVELTPSPVERAPRDDLASLVLMWILILSIGFLVYRRLKKSYGIDLVTYLYSLTS